MTCISPLLKKTATPFSNKPVANKLMVSRLNSFNSAIFVKKKKKKVYEKLRIYQQLLNSKIHMCNNNFSPQRNIVDTYLLYFTTIHH